MELPQNPTTLITSTSTSTSYDSNFIDHLFHPPIEEDENSEWLSVFVEDCFSTPGNFVIPSTNHPIITKLTNPIPSETLKPDLNDLTKVWKKKKRSVMKVKAHKTASIFGPAHFKLGLDLRPNPDPPLLHQSHWLADSELISPTKHEQSSLKGFSDETVWSSDEKKEKASVNTRRWTHCQADSELISLTKHEQSSLKVFSDGNVSLSDEKKKKASVTTTRRCTHCQADKTPLWRQGPSGKGTLCNACGVRWLKTGALFPEYRPANSPTFVRDLHSNVLRKVLKMREARLSSSSGISDE